MSNHKAALIKLRSTDGLEARLNAENPLVGRASRPQRVGPARRVRLLPTLKRLWLEIGDDDVGGVAASLAYHFLLALFPFFIFLTALGGLAATLFERENPAPGIVRQLGANLPAGISGLFAQELSGVIRASHPGLLSLGILAALWATMGGMKSLMRAMNLAYDVPESRPFWKQNLVALGLSVLFGLFLLGAFALFMAGELFARQIADVLHLPSLSLAIARWLIVGALLLVATAFLYWAAPNVDLRFKWVTPGSVLFSAGWLVATVVFAVYVEHFASYNATYGTLGGAVVLLVWFFLTGYILVLGAELNAIIDQQVDPARLAAGRQRKRAEIAGQQAPGHRRTAATSSQADSSAASGSAPVAARRAAVHNRPSIGYLAGLGGLVLAALLLWMGRDRSDA